MATIRSEYYRLNGSTWDLYLFRTSAELVNQTEDRSFLTASQKFNVNTYLKDFNTPERLLKLDEYGKIPEDIATGIGGLPLTGGTVTGSLTVNGEFKAKSAVRLNDSMYIDPEHGIFAGGTAKVTGIEFNTAGGIDVIVDSKPLVGFVQNGGIVYLDMKSKLIRNLAKPISPYDAATKEYVDQMTTQTTQVVSAVDAASTTKITYFTGLPEIDGVTLKEDDRILLKDQTVKNENGIYTIKSTGWERSEEDSDARSLAFVLGGDTHKGKQFYTPDGYEWHLFFIQDTYHPTDGRGLELDETGLGFGVKEEGIIKSMLHPDVQVLLGGGNLKAFGHIDDGLSIDWSSFGSMFNVDNTVQVQIKNILRALQKIRGTESLSISNTKSLESTYAYASTKTRIGAGKIEPEATLGYEDGDVYLKELQSI